MNQNRFDKIRKDIERSGEIKNILIKLDNIEENIISENNSLKREINNLIEELDKVREEYQMLIYEKDEMHKYIVDIKEHLKNLNPTLSPKQTKILQQLKEGFTFSKIAELNNISSGTVDYHKKKFISLGLL